MEQSGLFDQDDDLEPEPVEEEPPPTATPRPRIDPRTLPRGDMSDEQYKWIMWKFWGIEV